MQRGNGELEMQFTNGSRGGAALCGDHGELTSRETVWGVVNAVGQDPVGCVSVKSPEVLEAATRSASHSGKKMGVVSSRGAEVSSQRRACLCAFLGPVSELPSEGLIWVLKSGLPSQLSEICLFQSFP